MSVLKRASRIRLKKLAVGVVQALGALGLILAALSIRSDPLTLIVTMAAGVLLGVLAKRSFDTRAKFGPQAKAEKVLRQLVPDLEYRGFQVARRLRLPPGCRDYLVLFNKEGDLAFVIGLSGGWPGRSVLEGPQNVATELSSYGVPHVPVILAAFLDGDMEQDALGVLAVTPLRLANALEDVEEAFYAARDTAKAPPIPLSQIQHKEVDPNFDRAFDYDTDYREVETWQS